MLGALSPSERKYLLSVIEAAGGLSFKPSNEQLNLLSRALHKSPSSVRRYVSLVNEAIGRGGIADLATFLDDVKDSPDISLDDGIPTPYDWGVEYKKNIEEAAAQAVKYVNAADHSDENPF